MMRWLRFAERACASAPSYQIPRGFDRAAGAFPEAFKAWFVATKRNRAETGLIKLIDRDKCP